jgi:WD40 repeat protein
VIDNPEPVAKFAYANPAAVLWSPDGRYLAAQRDQDVRVWELKTRQSICQLTLPERPISLSFTKGGDALAAVFSGGAARAGERQYAKLWSVVNGKELKSFEPSVGADYSKLLNLADTSLEIGMGADLAQRKGINTDGRVVALDQESGYLVTISDRNTVRVWLLRPEDVIEEACRRLPRNLTADEWREYVKDDAYRKTCPKLP